jgi:hypothetical protein
MSRLESVLMSEYEQEQDRKRDAELAHERAVAAQRRANIMSAWQWGRAKLVDILGPDVRIPTEPDTIDISALHARVIIDGITFAATTNHNNTGKWLYVWRTPRGQEGKPMWFSFNSRVELAMRIATTDPA